MILKILFLCVIIISWCRLYYSHSLERLKLIANIVVIVLGLNPPLYCLWPIQTDLQNLTAPNEPGYTKLKWQKAQWIQLDQSVTQFSLFSLCSVKWLTWPLSGGNSVIYCVWLISVFNTESTIKEHIMTRFSRQYDNTTLSCLSLCSAVFCVPVTTYQCAQIYEPWRCTAASNPALKSMTQQSRESSHPIILCPRDGHHSRLKPCCRR